MAVWNPDKMANLITMAYQGDASPLLREIEPLVRSIVKNRVAPQDVDDVTQEALHAVYSKLNKLVNIASFQGWVMTIARREAAEFYRTAKHYVALDEDYDEYCEDTPVTELDRKEEIIRVQEAVSCLPNAEQDILMDFYNGSKVHEIAGRLGKPIGTIKRRLFDIRKKLEVLLRES